MQVALRVKSFCGNPASDANSRVFSAFPIVIGRSVNCDYRLVDPSRYISANHAIVTLEGQTLRIRDCSSNGVFIDNASSPIGRDQTVSINHGCLISIGDYTLELSLQNASNNPTAPNSFSSPTASDDPFDILENTEMPAAVKPNAPPVSPAFTGQNADPFADDDYFKGIGEPAQPPHNPNPFANETNPPNPSAASQETVALPFPEEAGTPDPWDEKKVQHPPLGGKPNAMFDAQTPRRASSPQPRPSHPPPPQPLAHPPSQPRPRPSRATPQARNAPNDSKQAANRLLEGAGISGKQLPANAQHMDLMACGKLLAQLTDGVMQLLKSRSEIKKAIKSDLTTLGRSNNNPLKFSYSANDALTKLLFNDGDPGYLSSEHAVDQAITDLNLHQLAMLEGMKAAVATLVKEFDPQILEEKLESESPISASIPLRKEAKLWESYEEKYAVLRDEAVSDFDELFSREFRKAYERKIRELGRTPDF